MEKRRGPSIRRLGYPSFHNIELSRVILYFIILVSSCRNVFIVKETVLSTVGVCTYVCYKMKFKRFVGSAVIHCYAFLKSLPPLMEFEALLKLLKVFCKKMIITLFLERNAVFLPKSGKNRRKL
jgi:hypothetical protein